MKRLCSRPSTALRSQVRWSSSNGGEAAPKTMFEQLDAMFSSAPVAPLSAEAVAAGAALPFGSHWMIDAASALGIGGGALLLAAGAATRLATLYGSLYGDRASARMQCALPELKPAYDAFQRIYNNERYKATEVQVESTKLQEFKNSVYAKHNTSNIKSLAALAGSPLILYGFRCASRVSDPIVAVGFGSQTFLWCTLGMPDPSYVLAMTSCGLTLLNFELSLSAREGIPQSTGWMRNVVLAARVAAVSAVPVVGSMNSGVILYWIGMSLTGLLQPLLLRSTAFKQFFGIPSAPTANSTIDDPLRERFGMEHPFLNRLFNPETEENVELITKATMRNWAPEGTATTSAGAKCPAHFLAHRRSMAKPAAGSAVTQERPITSMRDMAADLLNADENDKQNDAASEKPGDAKKSGANFASWKGPR